MIEADELRLWLEDDLERLWLMIEAMPESLLELAEWMQPIGGLFPPARMSWHEWMMAVIQSDPSDFFMAKAGSDAETAIITMEKTKGPKTKESALFKVSP